MAIDLELALAELPLLAGLSAASLGDIVQSTRELRARGGEVIYRQGERPQAFYHVVSGQIKVAIASDEGDEKVIEVYSPGHSFGIAELFGTQPHHSFAQATAETRLLHVGRPGVLRALEREPMLSTRMLTHLADRESSLERDIAAYCFHSGCRRVVDFLLRQAGPRLAEATILDLPMSKKLIAARLGLTPESLSRALRDLVTAGLISVRGRRITLHEALVARAAGDGGAAAEPADHRRRRSDATADRTLPARPVGSRAWV